MRFTWKTDTKTEKIGCTTVQTEIKKYFGK